MIEFKWWRMSAIYVAIAALNIWVATLPQIALWQLWLHLLVGGWSFGFAVSIFFARRDMQKYRLRQDEIVAEAKVVIEAEAARWANNAIAAVIATAKEDGRLPQDANIVFGVEFAPGPTKH